MKPWEDIADVLSTEIKRELAEAYFSEKLALEESWEEYKRELKSLDKLEEALILNACRLMLMLGDEELWDEFEAITNFSLKKCYHPQIIASSYIKKTLFEKLGKKPFAFTSKNRFVKLFLNIYEDLIKAYQAYKKKKDDLENLYEELKKETESFYRRYDLSQILGFFSRLEGASLELGPIEEKEKVYEEISSTLKISLPESPAEKTEAYNEPKSLNQISNDLRKLAKSAFEHHQEYAKELLSLAAKKG